MKQVWKHGFKIYLFLILYVLLSGSIYTWIIFQTKQNFSLISKLIVSGIGFMFVGFCYGNACHKKGLIVGLISGLVHIGLCKLYFLLAHNTFDFSWILVITNTLLSGIGGILGMNIKKLF